MYQDEENPLGDIDPMVWLESLAARQGATEGFTTDQRVDVPEIDPDTVQIDEPGYTPYVTFGQDTSQVKAETPATPPPAQPEYGYAPPPQPPEEPVQPAEPPPMSMGIDGIPEGVDPIVWLESLAARQGATIGFTTTERVEVPEIDPNTVVIDEPGYTPSESFTRRAEPPQEAPPPEMPAEPTYQEPAAWQPSDYYAQQPPASDSTAFLDELAGEVGSIPGVEADFGAEPTDYYTQQPPPEPSYQEPAAWQPSDDYAQQPPASDTSAFLDELSGEVDKIPGVEADFGADMWQEAITPAWAEPEPPELTQVPQQTATDLSWLDNLSGELYRPEPPPSLTEEPEAIEATHTPQEVLDSTAGMSIEELESLRDQGLLSGEQELALEIRKAQRNMEERGISETPVPFEELPPAEAGEIPTWLQQSARVTDEQDSTSIFLDSIPAPSEPEDMPLWLAETGELHDFASEIDLPEFTLEAADSVTEEPGIPVSTVESPPAVTGILHLEDYDASADEWAEALDEEHDRQITGQVEDPTWFRDAMEHVEAIEAVAQESFAPEMVTVPEPETPVAPSESLDWLSPPPGEAAFDETYPDDLPDWLRPAPVEDEDESRERAEDIDTWLRDEETGGTMMRSSLPEAVVDSALALPPADDETLPKGKTGPLPEWSTVQETTAERKPAAEIPIPPPPPPPAPKPEPKRATATIPTTPPPIPSRPAVRPTAVVGEPVPPAGPPAPVPDSFEEYKARLEANPSDHAARLELARAMANAGDVNNSVPQYQTLIENMTEMDTVADDLRGLIARTPSHPALRRLLGDIYMRQGYLQEALDAYRGALDNL
jgi:hypothetical protein